MHPPIVNGTQPAFEPGGEQAEGAGVIRPYGLFSPHPTLQVAFRHAVGGQNTGAVGAVTL